MGPHLLHLQRLRLHSTTTKLLLARQRQVINTRRSLPSTSHLSRMTRHTQVISTKIRMRPQRMLTQITQIINNSRIQSRPRTILSTTSHMQRQSTTIHRTSTRIQRTLRRTTRSRTTNNTTLLNQRTSRPQRPMLKRKLQTRRIPQIRRSHNTRINHNNRRIRRLKNIRIRHTSIQTSLRTQRTRLLSTTLRFLSHRPQHLRQGNTSTNMIAQITTRSFNRIIIRIPIRFRNIIKLNPMQRRRQRNQSRLRVSTIPNMLNSPSLQIPNIQPSLTRRPTLTMSTITSLNIISRQRTQVTMLHHRIQPIQQRSININISLRRQTVMNRPAPIPQTTQRHRPTRTHTAVPHSSPTTKDSHTLKFLTAHNQPQPLPLQRSNTQGQTTQPTNQITTQRNRAPNTCTTTQTHSQRNHSHSPTIRRTNSNTNTNLHQSQRRQPTRHRQSHHQHRRQRRHSQLTNNTHKVRTKPHQHHMQPSHHQQRQRHTLTK